MGAPPPPHTPDASPVRRCQCGAPIGDGDWANGHRYCAWCRPRHSRPGGHSPAVPTPRRSTENLPRSGVFPLAPATPRTVPFHP